MKIKILFTISVKLKLMHSFINIAKSGNSDNENQNNFLPYQESMIPLYTLNNLTGQSLIPNSTDFTEYFHNGTLNSDQNNTLTYYDQQNSSGIVYVPFLLQEYFVTNPTLIYIPFAPISFSEPGNATFKNNEHSNSNCNQNITNNNTILTGNTFQTFLPPQNNDILTENKDTIKESNSSENCLLDAEVISYPTDNLETAHENINNLVSYENNDIVESNSVIQQEKEKTMAEYQFVKEKKENQERLTVDLNDKFEKLTINTNNKDHSKITTELSCEKVDRTSFNNHPLKCGEFKYNDFNINSSQMTIILKKKYLKTEKRIKNKKMQQKNARNQKMKTMILLIFQTKKK